MVESWGPYESHVCFILILAWQETLFVGAFPIAGPTCRGATELPTCPERKVHEGVSIVGSLFALVTLVEGMEGESAVKVALESEAWCGLAALLKPRG